MFTKVMPSDEFQFSEIEIFVDVQKESKINRANGSAVYWRRRREIKYY